MTFDVTAAAPRYTARVAHYAPGAPFGPRLLHDYELVWILSGSATWEFRHPDLAAPTRHALRPGDVLIARAGGADSYTWDEHNRSSHAYLHFDMTGEVAEVEEWPVVRRTGRADLVWGLCEHLLDLSNRDDDSALPATRRALVVLLEAVLGRRGAVADSRLAESPLGTVVSHLRNEWRTRGLRIVPLEELAAAAGITTGHLSRVFSREFGCGLSASLELVRLGRAAIELQRSNLTIAEIARQTGFANPYHFSRRFSHAYGMPPGRFRRDGTADALAPLSAAELTPLWNALQRT